MIIDLVAIMKFREHLQHVRPHTVAWYDSLHIDDQSWLATGFIDCNVSTN